MAAEGVTWDLTRDYDDGLTRCGWPGKDELYIGYHDTEWGVPLVGENELFERIALEGFQAGLSWITILKRRDGFRAAFADFEIEKVAEFSHQDADRLMQDAGIIRNRAKIEATISNARLILELRDRGQTLTELIWSFAPAAEARRRPETGFNWIATSPESDAMSKALRKLGFKFVGSTTLYAMMQAIGMLNDHAPGCFRRDQLA